MTPVFALKNNETRTPGNSLPVISNKVPHKIKKKNKHVIATSVLVNNAACTFNITGGNCRQ
jgi:hypothetical protein